MHIKILLFSIIIKKTRRIWGILQGYGGRRKHIHYFVWPKLKFLDLQYYVTIFSDMGALALEVLSGPMSVPVGRAQIEHIASLVPSRPINGYIHVLMTMFCHICLVALCERLSCNEDAIKHVD